MMNIKYCPFIFLVSFKQTIRSKKTASLKWYQMQVKVTEHVTAEIKSEVNDIGFSFETIVNDEQFLVSNVQ